MSRLLAAELLKLRTIRTTWGFALALVGLVALFVAIPLFAAKTVASADDVADTIATAGIAALIMLVYGVVGITTETRHGTLAATFLVTPQRPRVVAAKALAHAVVGAAFTVLAFAVAGLLVGAWLLGHSGDLVPAADDLVRVMLGTIAMTALLSAFGVGVGALIPGQASAITATLLLFFVVEPLLGTASEVVADHGLNATTRALSASQDAPISQGLGGLLLLGYTVVVLVAGAVLTARRDVAG